MTPRAPLVVAALALTLAPSTALAFHTPEHPITEDTAHTRQKGHARLGLLKLQVGVLDSLTVGTVWIPWVLKVANLHVKWRFYRGDKLTLALQVSSLSFHTRDLKALEDEPGEARVSVFTTEPLASYRFDQRWTLSAGLPFTAVRLDGQIEEGAFHGAGAGAVNNFQLTSTLEYRATRVTAFVLHARYLVVQSARLTASATLRPDEYTTIEAHGSGSTDALDFPRAWSVVSSVVFSWERLNVRLGVGYGNWSLPLVNFVLPTKTLIPDAGLAWYF